MFNDFSFGGISPWFAFGLIHFVMAIALWKMAERTKEESAWFAIVPLLNVMLFLKLAQKPAWWVVLFFLPIVNLIALVVATMSLCERFEVNKWWGLLAIISPANLLLYLYLAFGTNETVVIPPTQTPPASQA